MGTEKFHNEKMMEYIRSTQPDIIRDNMEKAIEIDDADESERFAREYRNILLAESDFCMTVDRYNKMTDEQKSAWETYRQELRDIPEQDGFPLNIKWPKKPE